MMSSSPGFEPRTSRTQSGSWAIFRWTWQQQVKDPFCCLIVRGVLTVTGSNPGKLGDIRNGPWFGADEPGGLNFRMHFSRLVLIPAKFPQSLMIQHRTRRQGFLCLRVIKDQSSHSFSWLPGMRKPSRDAGDQKIWAVLRVRDFSAQDFMPEWQNASRAIF